MRELERLAKGGHELDVEHTAIDLRKQLADLEASIDARDAAMAAKEKCTVEDLRARREEAHRQDVEREGRRRRIEMLGKDKRRITPEDFDLVVVENHPGLRRDVKALRVVDRFMRSQRNFCVLSGPKGIGKTFAACFWKARVGGLIISADTMLTAWRNEHEDARQMRGRIEEVPFLVVDELGFEKDVDAGIHGLQSTVNERQGVGMHTLITTNLSERDLFDRYDARTTERITHGGAFVELTGDSMRRKS